MTRTECLNIKYVEIIALWKILYQINLVPYSKIQNILYSAQSDYSLGGNLPVKTGFKLCVHLRVVDIKSDAKVELSKKGSKLIKMTNSNEPNPEALREIIHHLIYENKFPWLMFSTTDEVSFRSSVPDNWEVILDNCGLFDFKQPTVVKWWNSLFFKYNKDRQERFKQIGDIGESLTYKLEQQRINQDGFDSTMKVNWVASFNDRFGFDVISLFGSYHVGKDSDSIFIEVKSSELHNPEKFRFFITRNEWNIASDNLNKYFFYCWTGVKLSGCYQSGPFTFSALDIAPLIPQDQDSSVEWTECRLILDITKFNILTLNKS